MLVIAGLCLPACAHVQGVGGGRGEEAGSELSRLRQDHAQLRQRVRELEKRLQHLESGAASVERERDIALASVGSDDPGNAQGGSRRTRDPLGRDLPVVKLEPKGSETVEPGVRIRHARTLTAATRETEELPQEDWAVESRSASRPATPAPTAPDAQEGSSEGTDGLSGSVASYRLVGSRLVRLTTAKPVRPDRPPRGKKGNAIVAEYEAAMDLYRTGEAEQAAERFAAFVGSYPGHDYADNALYWQGEASYDQGHFGDALSLFTEVVERYGGGNKAPDALLKIGLCYARLGDEANAKDVLTQLIAAYPQADATRIAESKLADMTGEQP